MLKSPSYHKCFYTHSIHILNLLRPEYLTFLTCILHFPNWFLEYLINKHVKLCNSNWLFLSIFMICDDHNMYLFISNHTNIKIFVELMEFMYLYIHYEVGGGEWPIEIYKGILIKIFLLLFNILYYVRNNIIWDSVLIKKDRGTPTYHLNGHN